MAGVEVRVGGKVGRGFGYEEDGIEKAGDRQREEDNEVSVHGVDSSRSGSDLARDTTSAG
jgi:hypothetical protein